MNYLYAFGKDEYVRLRYIDCSFLIDEPYQVLWGGFEPISQGQNKKSLPEFPAGICIYSLCATAKA